MGHWRARTRSWPQITRRPGGPGGRLSHVALLVTLIMVFSGLLAILSGPVVVLARIWLAR